MRLFLLRNVHYISQCIKAAWDFMEYNALIIILHDEYFILLIQQGCM